MTPKRNTDYYWRTTDFRPDSSGWQAVYLKPEEGIDFVPVVGWLIQEMLLCYKTPFEDHDPEEQDRIPGMRVTAGVLEHCNIIAADDNSNFWLLLGPGGGRVPTLQEEEAERARRVGMAAEHARKRKET